MFRAACYTMLALAMQVPRIYAQAIITTVAGSAISGSSGDGGPATNASLSGPTGLAFDSAGNLYISEYSGFRVRRISVAGNITTFAGGGLALPVDGRPATSATLNIPYGLAFDSSDNLYVAESNLHRVHRVRPDGVLTTVAGNARAGFSGDGGPATSASFSNPSGMVVDRAGNLYIADSSNSRVRRVAQNGTITTVAGNGQDGFSGDGGPAISAALNHPKWLALDAAGNLYISDSRNHRVRRVSAAGIITTVAGNGEYGFSGDGGLATNASLRYPSGLAVDSAGNLYIADDGNRRIRKVLTSGIITTIAGNGEYGFSGDGGSATSASLGFLNGLAFDAAGNLYLASSNRVRKIVFSEGGVNFPSIHAGGVVSGASFARAPAPVCAGSIVSIFGSGLASSIGTATSLPLPTNINGTELVMNGIAARLFFVSPGQINAWVPWELVGSGATVQITVNRVASNTITMNLAAECPGVFTANQSGSGAAIITHADGALVTAANPAQPGEHLTIYATGLGAVINPPPSGSPALAEPLSVVVRPPSVTIGGVLLNVTFAGLTPGFVGLYQINVRIPPDLPASTGGQLVVTVGGVNANEVVLIRSAPPLVFEAPETLPAATVRVPYQFLFCQPHDGGLTTPCGPFPPTTNPTGGLPPYHFQLDSGSGFPPIGIILHKDGQLRGTPTVAGTYRFRVCVVDLAGNEVCRDVILVVNAAGSTLTVTKAGTGTGTVTSQPAGIDCGTTCATTFTAGTRVTLTATAASGSVFTGWTGACTGTGNCTMNMDADKQVTAGFATVAPAQFRLTVTISGTGAGSVSSAPAGIDCGNTCSTTFPSGASATLSATAASGSTFAGWSGVCSGTGTCSVIMNSDRQVTATFNAVSGTATLTVDSLSCTRAPTTLSHDVFLSASGTASGPVGAVVSAILEGQFRFAPDGGLSSPDGWASGRTSDTVFTLTRTANVRATARWFFDVLLLLPSPSSQTVTLTMSISQGPPPIVSRINCP